MFNRLLGIGDRQTVGSVLGRHRGVGPGFDLLRILLALYIFYGHALWIAGGDTSVQGVAGLGAAAAQGAADAVQAAATTATAVAHDGFSGWTRPFHVAAVPVFFALSGFLVAGSALRLKATSTFLAFRLLRIFPALIVETVLCAVLLGSALTTLPLGDYFQNPVLYRYLGNIVGWISFHLPGVFEHNPVQGIVNANLWTLPSEFDCYAITAVLMLSGLLYRRAVYTALYAIAAVGFLIASLTTGFAITDGILHPVAVTFYFFTGLLFYHWKDKIPVHWVLFVASGAIGYGLLMFKQTAFITPVFVTYATVFFGMIAIPKLPLISKGDYSYGIYLYGFPITQGLVAAFPDIFVGHRYLLLAVAAVVTSLFAAFSWHVIEHRSLNQKRHLPAKWFPVPKKQVSQSPEGRIAEAEAAAPASA